MRITSMGAAAGLLAGIAVAQTPEAATSPQPGTIILYRSSTLTGAVVGCPIRFKGREIVELGRGKFAEWSVPPGRYIPTNKTSSVEVSVSPAERRYVRCAIKTGVLTYRADLQVVDEESFAEHRADYEEKPISLASGL